MMSQQPSEAPIFPSEITVSDGEESQKEVKEVLPLSSRSDTLRRSQKLQQGDKDLEIFNGCRQCRRPRNASRGFIPDS